MARVTATCSLLYQAEVISVEPTAHFFQQMWALLKTKYSKMLWKQLHRTTKSSQIWAWFCHFDKSTQITGDTMSVNGLSYPGQRAALHLKTGQLELFVVPLSITDGGITCRFAETKVLSSWCSVKHTWRSFPCNRWTLKSYCFSFLLHWAPHFSMLESGLTASDCVWQFLLRFLCGEALVECRSGGRLWEIC